MATEQIDTSLEDEKLISHLSGTLTFSDIASLDNGRLPWNMILITCFIPHNHIADFSLCRIF